MDDDSEEIYTSGLLKRYCKRPVKLKHPTLADWAAWYDNSVKPYVKQSNELDTDGLSSENFIDHYQNDEVNKEFLSKTNKNGKPRIRIVWFNKEAGPEKHYRKLKMLFTAWRNEKLTYWVNFLLTKNVIIHCLK